MKNKEYIKESDHSKEKKKLLALLLEEEGLNLDKLPAITPRKGGNVAPLSFAQQRLWFLNQLDTGSAYNIPLAIRLNGRPNIKALEDSLNEIIRRHEVLRTTFRPACGRLVQVIAENISIEMPLIDLSGQPKAEREVEAERLARDEAMRRFDLARGPLFSAVLIRLSEAEHILTLTMHHIVSDGWSLGIFTAELAALYKAYCNGEASPLPELPIQYADFAHWQREWLQGEVLENQLSYWRKQLEGVPVLQLFTDRPRPAVQTFAGASQNIALSPMLTEALNDLSQRQGVTLFITLLAAFQALLFRYTGEEDIVVGSPIANRNRTEIEGLIGFFVNSLVMRTDLSGNPSFLELLERAGEVAFGAYAHQDLPFEKLVEELHPERDMSRTPLFQIMFAVQNLPGAEVQLSGLNLSSVAVDRGASMFDLTLVIWERDQGLSGRVEYNTDLFDAGRIERMFRNFQTLLQGIVADPGKCICDLPILDEADRRQLLVEFNDTVMDYPKDKFIHELFEDQVNQTPDAIAVSDKNKQITYQELNTRSNQLAHYLKELGTEAQTVVGLCTRRSVEMVIGIMGILKAGGIYLPLDPSYPEERLSYMLDDSCAQILLTDKNAKSIRSKNNAQTIFLDSDNWIFARYSAEAPVGCVEAEGTAYLIYTSGSTGRPKGVIGLQRGLLNRFNWMWQNYPFTAGEICCQKTSISFVDSIWEILGPLLQGFKTVIFSDEVVQDPRLFIKNLADERVTRITAVPSYLRAILDAYADLQKRLPKLKFWISSGEILSKELYQRFCEQLPQSLLLNLYGSSEVSADVTCYETNSMKAIPQSVPIGRPIANTQVYILGPNLQPVPVGVPGEMYIGGDNLAAGYLNLSQITENAFIPNLFSDRTDSRLFKSGDICRWLADGNIEIIGRADHQVKIRGFRIELGEVETVLSQHPDVRETVVTICENGSNEKQLVAYFVPSRKKTSTNDDLHRYLKRRIPSYMVPSAFVSLEALPLMSNGKVDRRALPRPDFEHSRLETKFVAPRTPVEKVLAKIWGEVLGLKGVGVHDNFFRLGGHSLLATQVMSRARDNFELELPVLRLFETPTIAGLSESIVKAKNSDSKLRTPGISPISRKSRTRFIEGGEMKEKFKK